jgi:hypothetical protein
MSLVEGSVHRRRIEKRIDVLLNRRPVEPGVLPQPLSNRHRVDAGGPPPIDLVAVPVNRAMVGAAEGHRELIADPAPEGLRLLEPEMMSVGRLPTAEEAWLRGHELQMGAIAVAAGFAERKGAFLDMANNGRGRRTGMVRFINALIGTSRDNARFSPVLSVVRPSGAPRARRQ